MFDVYDKINVETVSFDALINQLKKSVEQDQENTPAVVGALVGAVLLTLRKLEAAE